MSTNAPQLILFSQHGMTDTHHAMAALARRLAPPQTHVVAPSLGYFNTLFGIAGLIETAERAAQQAFQQYPELPARIIATSLGGVTWVEVLSRHPDWWSRVESFVLLGSPIGGSDRARMVDPFGWGIGMAKALGVSRRALAERITAVIPTLVVAGDIDSGDDGLVTLESTKLKHAHFVRLPGVTHPQLRYHPAVVKTVAEFWAHPRQPLPAPPASQVAMLIDYFRAVPGMTDGCDRNFFQAKPHYTFADGTSIRTWRNGLGVPHVYVANGKGQCEFAGYVGWVHARGLQQALFDICSADCSDNG